MDGRVPLDGNKTGTYKRYPLNTPNNNAAIMATRRHYGLTTDFMEAFFIILMGIIYETVRDRVLGASGGAEAGWSVKGDRNRNLRNVAQRRQIHATIYNIVAHAASNLGITRLPLDIILGLREPTNGENLQNELLRSIFGADTTMEKRRAQFESLVERPEYPTVAGKAKGLGVDFSYFGSKTEMAALELVEKPVKKGDKLAVERVSDLEEGTVDKDYDFIHAHVSIPRTYFRTNGTDALSGWHFSNHHHLTNSPNVYRAFFSNAGKRFGKSRKAVKMAARERAAGAAAGAGGGGAEEVENNNNVNNTYSENSNNNNKSENVAYVKLAASAAPARKVIYQFEIQNSYYTPYLIRLYDDGKMTYKRVDQAEGAAGAAKQSQKQEELNVLTNAEIGQKVNAIRSKLTNLVGNNENVKPFIERLNAASTSIGDRHIHGAITKIKVLYRKFIDLRYKYFETILSIKELKKRDNEIIATIVAGALKFKEEHDGREPSPNEFMELFGSKRRESGIIHKSIQLLSEKAAKLHKEMSDNQSEYKRIIHNLKQLGQEVNAKAGDNDPTVIAKADKIKAMMDELYKESPPKNEGPAGGKSKGGRRRTLKVRRR